MTLLDTNVWIAHSFSAHPGHAAAATGLAKATSEAPAHFCRATQLSFLRLATTPALLKLYGAGDMTNDDALSLLDGLLASPNVAFHDEPQEIASLWHPLARRATTSPKLWMDAYLAAFAITANLSLVTFDAGFKQFEHAGLKLQLLMAH